MEVKQYQIAHQYARIDLTDMRRNKSKLDRIKIIKSPIDGECDYCKSHKAFSWRLKLKDGQVPWGKFCSKKCMNKFNFDLALLELGKRKIRFPSVYK